MNDLRYDQEEADAAAHAKLKRKTVGDRFEDYPAGAPENWHRIDPAQLRTVPPPDLRGGTARNPDCRTFDQQVIAELVRIVDALQGVSLRLEAIEGLIVELAKAAGIQEVRR